MRWRSLVVLGLIVSFAGLSSIARAFDLHKDEAYGFRLSVPSHYSELPVGLDEEWVVARYLSKKINHHLSDRGWTREHKPQLTVIVFDEAVIKSRVKDATSDKDAEKKTTTVVLKDPYKNYLDYLKRTYSEGGFYVSDEKTGEHRGLETTRYEIKVERSAWVPLRIITWVFHRPGLDLAVQFEVVESAYKKLRPEVLGCIKSFKPTEIMGRAEQPAKIDRIVDLIKASDLAEMPLLERREYMIKLEERDHQLAIESVPDDWTVKRMGRFLVLNHTDVKFARKVVEQAEAVFKWLDKNLDYIGKGEYVRSPIIRICKDWDEESSFRSAGTAWSIGGIEITTNKGTYGAASSEWDYVNTRAMAIWLQDRDSRLYSAFPPWLRYGFQEAFDGARAKGSRLEFKADEWENDMMREMERGDKLLRPDVIMKMSTEEFLNAPRNSWGAQSGRYQSGSFLRWLIAGPGSKAKKTKRILEEYVKNLKELTANVAKETKGEEPKEEAKTEEEEAERYKAAAKARKEREKRVSDEAYDKTFGDWTDKDWKSVFNTYKKSIG